MLDIFSMIASVIGSAVSAASQQAINEQNIALARELNQSQQEFARESAATANEYTRQNYWEMYSPQSKVNQLKDAGLSPGLMYSMGGVQGSGQAAAQAAQPNVTMPNLQPILGQQLMSQVTEAMSSAFTNKKTESETKKNESEINKIEQDIKESEANIKKIEEECKNYEISRINTDLQNKLLENDIKIKNATIDEQIEIIKENLELIRNTADKAFKETEILEIEKSKRNELLEAEIKKLQAEEKKLGTGQILDMANAAKAWAEKEYTNSKNTELLKRIQAIDDYGYMVVNGTGWQDRIINGMLEAVKWLAGKAKEKDTKFKGFYDGPDEDRVPMSANRNGAGAKF